jgi:hypothetical protein
MMRAGKDDNIALGGGWKMEWGAELPSPPMGREMSANATITTIRGQQKMQNKKQQSA